MDSMVRWDTVFGTQILARLSEVLMSFSLNPRCIKSRSKRSSTGGSLSVIHIHPLWSNLRVLVVTFLPLAVLLSKLIHSHWDVHCVSLIHLSGFSQVLTLSYCREPSCYKEVSFMDDKLKWEHAMQSEYDSIMANDTWDLVPLPKYTTMQMGL